MSAAEARADTPAAQLERHAQPTTDELDIDTTISRPGTVKINVQGAFIVDEDGSPRPGTPGEDHDHDPHTKDIRLPNHTAVVSHIAVDVCH